MKFDAAANEAEISIFSEIGMWGITVADFKKEFDAVKEAKSIKLLMNSIGGDVFDGMAIFNILLPFKAKLVVQTLGISASIASVIALAGKEHKMNTGAFYMIHSPWTFAGGSAKDLRQTADLLDQISGSMADIYVAKSGLSKEEVLALMEAETWMTAEEAISKGFADEEVEAEAVAASADFSRFKFQHAPQALMEKVTKKGNPPATLRDFEALLRDEGGFSRSQAAGIAKNGFSAVLSGEQGEQDSGESGEVAAPPKVSPEKKRAMDGRFRRLALAG